MKEAVVFCKSLSSVRITQLRDAPALRMVGVRTDQAVEEKLLLFLGGKESLKYCRGQRSNLKRKYLEQ